MQAIRQSLNKAFLKRPVNESEVIRFKAALNGLISNINNDEREEHNKNLVSRFLQALFDDSIFINTFYDDDLVIHNGTKGTDVGVIIEFKKPDNNSQFSQIGNLNKKSLQQLIFYYIEQRVVYNNSNVKHLIMTNCYEWFVYDVSVFAKCFDTAKLRSSYSEWKYRKDNSLQDSSTDWFYKNISSPAIEDHIAELEDFTHFNLKDLSKISDDSKLIPAIKFFTKFHLLKMPFAKDNNSLNKGFYSELLHIIGLEEITEGGKKLIRRIDKNKRNSASFIEQIIEEVDYLPISSNFKDISKEEHLFNIALQLSITWINRTLFIKLLEAQISNYKKDNSYKILYIDRIKDFDIYNSLFFKVLATKPESRSDEMKALFGDVPYLNSSLFEVSDLEDKAIRISSLQNTKKLPIYSSSVLTDDRNRKLKGELTLLEYLFKFLNSYDFGSVGSSVIRKDNKDLINSSVLGLIFEKINGYKDGSFFTPSYITMYMCRESIRKVILNKLNEKFGWTCDSFDKLKSFVGYSNRIEVNEVIDSLTICDPAVGSGHFLVSALNEIIVIKSELRILMDANNNTLRDYEVFVENDELILFHEDGEPFDYKPNSKESQRIQESLFNEKRKIIENSLFGVDLNPNSVNICCLRLWIELLKNTYYKPDGQLETLPNIDINIKCGNSLVSKYPIRVGESILKNVDGRTEFGKKIKEYKNTVAAYKITCNKDDKTKIKTQLKTIKGNIIMEFQLNLFEDETLRIDEHNVYSKSMEWMIEFPEILDDNGVFLGFDITLGNPPYGVSIKNPARKIITAKLGKVPDYEIFYYFIEIANKLLKDDGVLSYIIPNTYLFNTFAKDYRISLLNRWNMLEIMDCSKFLIFESATVRNTVNIWSKGSGNSIGYRNTANAQTFEELNKAPKNSICVDELLEMNQNWGLAFYLDINVVSCVNKIRSTNSLLSNSFDVSQGYIPYRKSDLVKLYGEDEAKSIVENRLWHSADKLSDEYIQEIFGKDINKYGYDATGGYVRYGKHVASYVDPKFFSNKRIVVREITNPTVIACLISAPFVNDPQLICVISKEERKSFIDASLEYLWGILNSKLATFYHFNHSPKATKGAFPKILVGDINAFPLPNLTTENAIRIGRIVDNVKRILEIKQSSTPDNTECIEAEIDFDVYKLYGLTHDEVVIVDPKTTISRIKYES